MPNLRRVGREAEDQAAEFLLGLGYTIVTRRYTARGGEIDLIALDGDVLVFVEVKQRSSGSFLAEEAVGAVKQSRMQAAAEQYLYAMEESDRKVRYDVIAIDRQGLRHWIDVFT